MVCRLCIVFAIMGRPHGTVVVCEALDLGTTAPLHGGLFRVDRAHALLCYRGTYYNLLSIIVNTFASLSNSSSPASIFARSGWWHCTPGKGVSCVVRRLSCSRRDLPCHLPHLSTDVPALATPSGTPGLPTKVEERGASHRCTLPSTTPCNHQGIR